MTLQQRPRQQHTRMLVSGVLLQHLPRGPVWASSAFPAAMACSARTISPASGSGRALFSHCDHGLFRQCTGEFIRRARHR